MIHFLTGYTGRARLGFFYGVAFACLAFVFCIQGWDLSPDSGDNFFHVYLNDEDVGTVADVADAEDCLRQARAMLARGKNELYLTNASLNVEGTYKMFGLVSSLEDVRDGMVYALGDNRRQTYERAYTVKINQYSVNLASAEEVHTLLETALYKYDEEHAYSVGLVPEALREVNVLTPQVTSVEEVRKAEEQSDALPEAGIFSAISESLTDIEPLITEKDFSDYDLGLQTIDFLDKVEIVESYQPLSGITPLEDAISEVTKDQERNQIYEVKAGDTLGVIAENYSLSLADLIQMNETLTNEFSTIRPGDELIVTVPRPELTVRHIEQEYYEEDYEAEVQYVDNDSWYTTQTKVLQEPSAGHRKVVVQVTYDNNTEVARDIEKAEITYMAVPKIVERGTIVPPTYIKPITGGRFTSGFGRRNRPTRGASSYHRGVDWATPVGTTVRASSSGVVAKAGWGSGYGYVVYINHPDGKQTRYGHLSRVLVRAGQSVSQGDKIALSGNTGVSTGPHIHFEILVNGVQVNPLEYLN